MESSVRVIGQGVTNFAESSLLLVMEPGLKPWSLFSL